MQDVREALPVGSVVHDRYIVEEVLGRGGFSAVYLVRDQRVQQNLFALKELIDPQKRERERFTFEAELLRRVDHPSLPRVYRVFEDDASNRAYILMDYIEGPNLEVLRRQQPEKRFSLQQVLSIMGPIMKAVAYLHQQHPPIIHRDIKPANIIVPTSGNEAVLVDFGIAKEFDPESTTTAIRHASPGYGSPEHYATGTNPRTDIYSLGATMYALLTGHVPADAFYRMTQLGGKGIDPLEPIHNYAPNVPPHIADAIYRAMAVDIDKRFPSVQDFWNALTDRPSAPIVAASAVAPIALMSRPADLDTPIPVPASSLPEAATVVNPVPGANRRNRRRTGAWLLLLLALLIIVASAAIFLPALIARQPGHIALTPAAKTTHQPVATTTRAPTSTATTTPPLTATTNPGSGYPTLANQYNGNISNALSGDTTSMALNSISQNGGTFTGHFQVGSPLSGNGPFTGTLSTSGALQFIVHSSQVAEPLSFAGHIHNDGGMSGTYCSLNSAGKCDNSNGYGRWNVSSPTSGSGS
ncbi:MAG TPA: serine/threonine-protein kinase [Ktedonobacteraceae bacterium]|nr:serine/threonine-protein kinase [Ktedonobacteraceae bacterium]